MDEITRHKLISELSMHDSSLESIRSEIVRSQNHLVDLEAQRDQEIAERDRIIESLERLNK